MNDLQNQESFSFSTSSKVGLLSGDEDGGADDHHHIRRRISKDHQKEYLEIYLPSPPPPSALITKTIQNAEKEEEFEFCFSFNSSSTLLDFPTTPIATSNHPFHDHEPPMSTSTCATSQLIDVVHKNYNHHNKSNNSIHYKHIFQRVTSPRCHQRLLSPYISRTPVEGRGATRSRRFEKNLPKLKNRNSARFRGIRKFMVKLRSIKSMLGSSLNLSQRQLQPSPIDKLDKKTKKTFTDHNLNKIDLQRNCGLISIKNGVNNKFVTNAHNLNRSKEEEKSFRMMKFDGFSKMMDVITKNIRITRTSKQTGSKSCPISIKSSPMHDVDVDNNRDERRNSFYSRDHSIQAAIAHCKKSFGK